MLARAQRGGNVLGDLAGAREIAGIETDGGDARMTASTVLFGDGGKVDFGIEGLPGVSANGNFCADG